MTKRVGLVKPAKKQEHEDVVKIRIFDAEMPETKVIPVETPDQVFGDASLSVPFDPNTLVNRYEQSSALRANIDAYVLNIEGFGHTLEPAIDLESKTARDDVRDTILMDRLYSDINLQDLGVTDNEIDAKILEIQLASRIEKLRLEAFFAAPAHGMSLIKLRKKLRRDLEVTGNWYAEVVRNKSTREVSQLAYAPAVNMRLTRSSDPVEVEIHRRISPVSISRIKTKRRFRRYLQRVDGSDKVVWFKEIGDPSIVSDLSGKGYPSVKEMKKEEPKAEEASEIIHYALDNPRSPYGVPRWIGASVAVYGCRAAEEINADYFDAKTIPPGFLLVSGGALRDGSAAKVEQYLRDHIKGRRNFHSIVVIEAMSPPTPDGAPPRTMMQWVPMTDQQQKDGLFLAYDERCTDKVGNAFRLPKILRGDMRDFNRSTAEIAVQHAEQQVFEPERRDIDEVFNEILFLHMGVRYWRFRSNSPQTRDPSQLAAIIKDVAPHVTPRELRPLIAKDVLHVELDDIDDAWVNRPFDVYELETKAGVTSEQQSNSSEQQSRSPEDMLDTLSGMREALQQAMEQDGEVSKELLRRLDAMPRDVIRLPSDEFDELFEKRDPGITDGDPVTKPFAGYDDFDSCIADQESKGYDAAEARRICGKLQSESEK